MFLNLTIYMSLFQKKTQKGKKLAIYFLHLIPDNMSDQSVFTLVQAFILCFLHVFQNMKNLGRLTLFILKDFIFIVMKSILYLYPSQYCSIYTSSQNINSFLFPPQEFFKNSFSIPYFTIPISILWKFKIRHIFFYSPISFLFHINRPLYLILRLLLHRDTKEVYNIYIFIYNLI